MHLCVQQNLECHGKFVRESILLNSFPFLYYACHRLEQSPNFPSVPIGLLDQ